MALLRANYQLGAAPGQSDYNKMYADAVSASGTPQYSLWTSVKPLPNMAEYNTVALGDVGHLPARSSEAAALQAAAIAELGKITIGMTEYGIRFDSPKFQWDTLPAEVRFQTPVEFANAATSTMEQLAANILVNAFSTTGFDGKALCASDHPVAGGVNDNEVATALSATSLGVARGLWGRMKTSQGKPLVRKGPKYLVVSPENEVTARTIINASWTTASGSGSDGNANQGYVEVLVCPWLTSAVDWFLVGDPMDSPNGAIVVVNRAPEFVSGFDATSQAYFGISSLVAGAGFGSYNWIVGSNT
jgi:hypothetical protein